MTNEVDANVYQIHFLLCVFTYKEESTTISSLSVDFLFLKTSQGKKKNQEREKSTGSFSPMSQHIMTHEEETPPFKSGLI